MNLQSSKLVAGRVVRLYCGLCLLSAAVPAAASNKRLQSAGDELTGQREVFKESHGLLGALKRQAMVDRWVEC